MAVVVIDMPLVVDGSSIVICGNVSWNSSGNM